MDTKQLELMVSEAKSNGSCRCSIDVGLLKYLVRNNIVDTNGGLNIRKGNEYKHFVYIDGVELVARTRDKLSF